MNMNLYVIFLQSIWMNQKMNLFQKNEHDKTWKKIKFLCNNKLKFNLEPKT